MTRPAAIGTLVTLAAIASIDARPNRYGHSDREERHMLPAVSSGPLDPAWSPGRPLDRLLDARRHLEDAGRGRRSDRDHLRSRVPLRTGVESGRHAHRASRSSATAILTLASSAPTAARSRRSPRIRAWTFNRRGAATARACSSRARALAGSASSGTTCDRHRHAAHQRHPASGVTRRQAARVRAGRACACSTSPRANRAWSATRKPNIAWSRRGRRTARTSCTSPKTKAPTTFGSCRRRAAIRSS